MTAATSSQALISTTDAGFRIWGKAISDMMLAIGLTKGTDTGQIDWTTVLAPAAGGQVRGYEIWRFNDALQATAPIFMKLEYGSNGGYPTSPGIWLTVGSGTDGAGNITGTMYSSRGLINQQNPAVAGNWSNFGSYVATLGCMGMVIGQNACQAGQPGAVSFFAVGRVCDANGAPTGEGIYVYGTNGQGTPLAQVWSLITNTKVLNQIVSYAMVPGAVGSLIVGSDVQLVKHFYALPLFRSTMGLMTTMLNDISQNATFSATAWGATAHTYLSLGGAVTGAAITAGTATLVMLYE